MKKIYVFWHNYLANEWKIIVEDQFSKLVKSGLYESCEKISCGVVCNPEDVDEHKEFIKNLMLTHNADPNKFETQYTYENNFEYLTLRMLQDFAKNNDAYVLYFHTKGASCPASYTRLKAIKKQKRNHMEDINILRWRECVGHLDEGNMCCGTNKRKKFYVGNFWWANTDYIKTLPELKKITNGDRAYYEKWLLWSKRGTYQPQPKLYIFPWE